jgi:hypothetical protein
MKTFRALAGLAFATSLFFSAASTRGAERHAAPGPGSPDTSSTNAAAAPHPSAGGDALLEALLTELDRSKAQLKIDQVQAPYYIEYRVNDIDDYDAQAAFGALH